MPRRSSHSSPPQFNNDIFFHNMKHLPLSDLATPLIFACAPPRIAMLHSLLRSTNPRSCAFLISPHPVSHHRAEPDPLPRPLSLLTSRFFFDLWLLIGCGLHSDPFRFRNTPPTSQSRSSSSLAPLRFLWYSIHPSSSYPHCAIISPTTLSHSFSHVADLRPPATRRTLMSFASCFVSRAYLSSVQPVIRPYASPKRSSSTQLTSL